MDDDRSPLDQLLEGVESALSARRAQLSERVRRIELALTSYRRAVEAQIASDFAREHGFKQPKKGELTPERAAELLKSLVDSLPEQTTWGDEVDPAATSDADELPESVVPLSSEPPPSHPLLARAARKAKLVIIGALSGRDKAASIPTHLASQIEWVDTERDGAHAVGNLPQRIRQGRVAAVVILERAVQHKHTEPVMGAARDAGVPVAFAGQGGKASLGRAFEQLEGLLARSR